MNRWSLIGVDFIKEQLIKLSIRGDFCFYSGASQFDGCHQGLTVARPAKYERDVSQVNLFSIFLKHRQNLAKRRNGQINHKN